MKKIETSSKISLLNLPESTLDVILELLSPIELINMSKVCTYLRGKCRSDHLWENHMKQKWGRVFGHFAFKEWQWHVTIITKEEGSVLNQQINILNGSLGSFSGSWPMLCVGSYLEECHNFKSLLLANHFMMALYLSLESGKFWFPAQLYRGLYVHDTLVSYNSITDTFRARTRSWNGRIVGNDIHWDKLRFSPVETSSCVRHVSDCFQELKPGDHIEIQWRGNTQAPYDWWYAVIGHLDSCNENENYCLCQNSETLVVEFKQYPQRSSMRKAKLTRHTEDSAGNYGGIRKLHSQEEIQKWNELLDHQRYI
ncbi:unnamed protein product [Trifolium pratense]|uniref:Uncharacterized protein n=1 Tax=Trifolium pratense TaxID=57577 RepID=A0ACB0LX49_TRIPR|nr:unnamed protein product [Trifolium pratense]